MITVCRGLMVKVTGQGQVMGKANVVGPTSIEGSFFKLQVNLGHWQVSPSILLLHLLEKTTSKDYCNEVFL